MKRVGESGWHARYRRFYERENCLVPWLAKSGMQRLNPTHAQLFFRLSERVEIHQVPGGHSSRQLKSAAAMLLKELTAGKGLCTLGLFERDAGRKRWEASRTNTPLQCQTPQHDQNPKNAKATPKDECGNRNPGKTSLTSPSLVPEDPLNHR